MAPQLEKKKPELYRSTARASFLLGTLAEDLRLEATHEAGGTDAEALVIQPFLAEDSLDEAVVLHRFLCRANATAELDTTYVPVLVVVLT